ncbi:DUF5683 domain-containing protein [Bacteroides stercorirosoris]|uniref:DUF5683 domain-containing protein n=1 Tax=Bacteroides stercorirosoris TaxID=871324 RepID=UPI0009670BB6|nr:DUF5683 domain-containing protein [Bacteroides stercorirosoris]OKZ09496.1 MAG: hypothetical protein BHV75_13530 [Bacteroides oleiciplenus]
MKIIFGFLLLCLCGINVQAAQSDKSDKIAPRWKNGNFLKNHDSSYYFKVVQGEGGTLSDACGNAVLTLVGDLASMHGVSVKGTAIEKIKAESRNHVYTENIEHNYTYNLDFENFRTAFTQIDIYWEKDRNGLYNCWVLFEVANNADKVRFQEVAFTKKYGARGLLYSLIPGVGQLYKGSTAKGLSILGGEAALAAAIVLCENTRASYVKKMKEQPKHAKTYNSKADNWETGRNVCIGAAAALYIYNLVDAAVANGAKRGRIQSGSKYLSMTPVVGTECNGLALTFHF